MPFILRRTTVPTLADIQAVPQIVIVDQTGPATFSGEGDGLTVLVGEFTRGPLTLTEPGSGGAVQALYGDSVYPYLSQSAAGVQDGSQGAVNAYEGNGLLQLLKKPFKRLGISRVDHEAVTTDGGGVRGQLTLTITVAASDQDGSGNTLRDIVVPDGARFGSSSTFAGSTRVFATSGQTVIPKGTALTTNTTTVSVNCFPVRVVEPVVATASASVTNVLDPVIPNAAGGTTITAVTNATALWPSGSGTTLRARLDSKYQQAIDRTVPGTSDLAGDVNVLWSARRSTAIRQALAANAAAAGDAGRSRVVVVSADPAATSSATDALAAKTAALGLVVSDGYTQPADRVIVTFPQSQVVVPTLGALSNVAVTVNSDGWMACTLSNFPPEANPGAQNEFIQNISSLEDAFVQNSLSKQDYANLLAAGVSPLQKDRSAGWWFVDGRTAAPRASFPTRYTIKRRRMADLIQDSIADIAAPYLKQPATAERVDAFNSEVVAFLEQLKSPTQPSLQRIVDYAVDDKSGNTLDLLGQGVFVLLVSVRILSTMDNIVIKTQIGETVVVAPAA